MDFQQLWAPWRIGYITGDKSSPVTASQPPSVWKSGADQTCFLCRAVAETGPDAARQNLLVSSSSLAVVLLNRYPYNNGHLLVAPRRHVPGLADLTGDEHLELMKSLVRLTGVLEKMMRAEGFNIGLNLGRVAGAGLPGHIHWHIVPRWNGDTNFMPTLAGVNVIPQSLEALLELLQGALKQTP
jgi:ATP adenylyltransferase